ncbi:MAG: hypothetical protein EXR71_15140 [Myxococcales bacterium]|nr:hypothetical protein [Myxococcales bacterium]
MDFRLDADDGDGDTMYGHDLALEAEAELDVDEVLLLGASDHSRHPDCLKPAKRLAGPVFQRPGSTC